MATAPTAAQPELVRPPAASIGAVEERELPPAPPLRKILGPGIILVGVGIASGEYILYPYIASQVGLMFLWAAFVGQPPSSSSTWRSSATRWPPARPP